MRRSRIVFGVFVLAGCFASGCGSDGNGSQPITGAGGRVDGAVVSSGGMSGGGTGGASPGSGGTTSTGGTLGSGGQSPAGTGGGTVGTGGATDGGIGGTGTGAGVDAGTGTGGRGGTTGTGGAPGTGGTAGGGGTGTSGGSSDGKTPIKVWMAGDSTMDNGVCTGCGSTACGWGSQLDSLFNANVTVDNKGKSGASTQTWLYGDANVSTNKDANGECIVTNMTYDPRWTAMLDANTGMKKGDYLIIEFGINDDGTVCNRRVGPALFQKYLTYMGQEAKNRGAQAILLTSTAAIICNGSTANTDTRNFGPETRAAGAALNAPVIDMTVLTAQTYTSLGLCPNNADYTSTTSAVGQFFCNDHTHFEKMGAAQIAAVFAKALKDQKIGLASYLLN